MPDNDNLIAAFEQLVNTVLDDPGVDLIHDYEYDTCLHDTNVDLAHHNVLASACRDYLIAYGTFVDANLAYVSRGDVDSSEYGGGNAYNPD